MNLLEYQAKKKMLEDEVRRFGLIRAGCQQCQHFDFGKCAAAGMEPIPQEFLGEVEKCGLWEKDEVPF